MGTPPIRLHCRRYGDARMVVGKVRGRLGRDEAGGRERMGGGRSMGQAIAGLCLVFSFLGWEEIPGSV
jgi:hypothetical protein